MTTEKIFDKIVSLIKENSEIAIHKISMSTSFQNDLGLDSMRLVGAIVAVEDSFDIEIPDNKLFKIKTVGDLVNYIEDNI
ncbi:MAG: acyl carrier protein [Rikenellaceae bacterium]